MRKAKNKERDAQPPAERAADPYGAIRSVLGDDLLTPNELADHVQLTTYSLHMQRRRGTGLPFLKLPTGAVRYRLSDIVAAEIQSNAGPLTAGRVCLALAACEGLSAEARLEAQEAVRKAFG